MKICVRCKEEKDNTSFYEKRRGSVCKACNYKQSRNWKINNPDRVRLQSRRRQIKDISVPESKRCSRCNKTKDWYEFKNNKYHKDGLSSHCRECESELRKTPEYKLREKLRKYKLTIQEYEQILNISGYKCFICEKHIKGKDMNIDHDHVTGNVRGLLCTRCNMGVAFLEREGWLCRAQAYLAAGRSPLSGPTSYRIT